MSEPVAPRAWRPGWSLLKPAAALYNAARRASYERRVLNAGPGQRVTTEEHGLRESLTTIHDALAQRAPQAALSVLTERFETGAAKDWFHANGSFSRYRDQAMEYYRFTERAVRPVFNRSAAAERARLEAQLGVTFGRDVGQGMSDKDMSRYASLLGMSLASRAPPSDEAGWLGLLRGPEQPLLTYRMFHPRLRLDGSEGHDYRVLYHATYLLGAFPSPSRGATLFMVQDSGSGITAFLTAEELTALVKDVQLLAAAAPVRLPQAPGQ